MKNISLNLTPRELKAVATELETSTMMAEENPPPYHRQHHDAKRALKKIKAALDATRSADQTRDDFVTNYSEGVKQEIIDESKSGIGDDEI